MQGWNHGLLLAVGAYLALQLTACTGASVDLEREARGIPWDKLSGKIAYARWDGVGSSDARGRIFLIDVPARRVDLLRDVPTPSSAPTYEPTGWARDLAFEPGHDTLGFAVENPVGVLWELRAIDIPSRAERVLFPDPAAHHNFPSWSGDGQLAFYENGAAGVYLRVDGAIVNVDPSMSRVAWVSSSALIASVADASTSGALYSVNLATGSLAPLITSEGGTGLEMFWSPAVSPNGQKLVYVRGGPAADGNEIWIADVDGRNRVRVSHGFSDFDPAWSADGSAIVFGRLNEGLKLYDLRTSALTVVTSTPATSMAWSP